MISPITGRRTVVEEAPEMMGWFKRRSLNPLVVGAAIGVLSWITFVAADRAIGITTAFENAAAMALGKEGRGPAGKTAPKVDAEWALVLGALVGGWMSARLSGDRPGPVVPRAWAARFGSSTALRMGGAFAGGALMMFGARMAQGCTSGHGISGALQLALSSWIFLAVMFPVAIATAHLVFGKEGRSHV